RFLASRGEGTHHICFQVDDIHAALAELAAQGLRLIDETPRQGVHGLVAFIHPKATHGLMIELLQYPADHDAVSQTAHSPAHHD
ncbi:VOC family protein, partial [Arthrospira platensis SPKY2]